MSKTTAPTANAAPNPKAVPTPNARALGGPRHDPAESFARLSRAVRLTLALEATVEDQPSALRAGEADAETHKENSPWRPPEPTAKALHMAHQDRVRDLVAAAGASPNADPGVSPSINGG